MRQPVRSPPVPAAEKKARAMRPGFSLAPKFSITSGGSSTANFPGVEYLYNQRLNESNRALGLDTFLPPERLQAEERPVWFSRHWAVTAEWTRMSLPAQDVCKARPASHIITRYEEMHSRLPAHLRCRGRAAKPKSIRAA